jgi:hypothetical protein
MIARRLRPPIISLQCLVSPVPRITIGAASRFGFAHELAQVIPEPVFDIPRLVEPTRDQGLAVFLRGGPSQRRDARVPASANLDVRRQAGVDQALVLEIAHLSNEAMRVASASTNSSSLASGSDRFT